MKIWLVLLLGCFTFIVSVLAQAKSTAQKSDFRTSVLSETRPLGPASTPCPGVQAAWLDHNMCSQPPSTENGSGYLPDVPQLQVADPNALSKPATSFRRAALGCASLGLECPLPSKSEATDGRSNSAGSHPSDTNPPNVPARPAAGGEASRQRVEWSSLLKQELLFLSVMNGFRVATEPGTLEGLKRATWG